MVIRIVGREYEKTGKERRGWKDKEMEEEEE